MDINKTKSSSCTMILVAMGALCFVFIVIVIIGVYVLVVKFHYDYDNGLNYKGAKRYYHTAMKEGNSNEAVYWSKRVLFYTNKNVGWTNVSEKLNKVAEAYELNNEQDQSQKIHEEIEAIDELFRQGKVKEARQRINELRHRVVNE